MRVQDSTGIRAQCFWPDFLHESSKEHDVCICGDEACADGPIEFDRVRMGLPRNVTGPNARCRSPGECSRTRVVGDHYADSGGQCAAPTSVEHGLKRGSFVGSEHADVHACRGRHPRCLSKSFSISPIIIPATTRDFVSPADLESTGAYSELRARSSRG